MTDVTQWLQQLRRGDDKAYRIFFEEYYQVLGVFALKYVKRQDVAEDIVNDVIVSLYSSRPQFDNLVAFKSFLYTAVRNRCMNLARTDKARQRYADAKLTDNEDFFLDSIIEEEVYFLLRNSISTLPEMPRRIYEMSLHGRSNEEIARELSLTVDSVKAYKKRGKQMLKEKLKGLMGLLSVTV